MKLQVRMALVPLVTVSVLCAGLYLLVGRLTVESFANLENAILKRQVQRVNNSVENLLEEHSLKIVDWSQWDKSYEFMETLDPGYIEVTLNALTISALGFKSVMYFTPKNDLRYGVTVDGEAVNTADPSLVEETRPIVSAAGGKAFRTVARLQDKLYLVAGSPILPNKADQPSRGELVALAEIPAETLDLLKVLTNLKLTFWESALKAPDDRSREVSGQLERGTSFAVAPMNDRLSYAYGRIADGAGKPVLFFRVEDARSITSAGTTLRNSALLLLSASGCLAALLLFGVIYFSASKRIEEFSQQVKRIAESGDSTGRLEDSARGSRSLRIKTASGVLCVFVPLSLATSVFFNRSFVHGFQAVESSVMTDNLERARRALEQRLSKMQAKTIDWAQWDDTYAFVQDRNEQYKTDNLGFDTLGRMSMKYVLYYDTAGALVDGTTVLPETETVGPVAADVAGEIAKIDAVAKAAQPTSGFLSLPNETIFVGASPILDTTREKPSRGSMVFAALADQTLATDLGHQVRVSLSFRKPLPESRAGALVVTPLEETLIQGHTAVTDLMNRPALELVIRANRPVYAQGLATVKLLPPYFVAAGLLCGLMTLLWVDRIVLSRVRRMGQEVSNIKLTGDVEKRLEMSGSDELSGLANDINSMLNALQKTQEELKHARLAAEAANAAKSMFIAKVSHELRTPIGSITGMNRMILKHEISPAVRDLVRAADQSAWSLLNVLNEILDFAKAESGNLTLERIPFELRPVLRETMQVMGGRLEGKDDLELSIDVHPSVPSAIIGDPTKLKQVLINLLGNAVKFTQRGAVGLRVSMESEGTVIKLEVWDTGVGIPKDKQESIFEPFKQADASVTRKYQGTGLGLAIVKQFTEALGGSVSIASEERKGTTFTIALPCTTAQAHHLPLELKSVELPSLTMVGRSTPALECLRKNLQLFGVSCTAVESITPESTEGVMNADAVLFTENALRAGSGVDAAVMRGKTGKKTLVTLKATSLELKDRLYEACVREIHSTPVLAEDIIGALLGRTADKDETRETDALNDLGGKRLRILVADDTPTNRIILEDMLSDAGHDVVLVSDGQELVECLMRSLSSPAEGRFDLVLTDITMPIMDGYEATRAVRKLEEQNGNGAHIPIIAITAHVLKDEADRMREAGVDGIVTKPVRPEKIAEALKSAISNGAPSRSA